MKTLVTAAILGLTGLAGAAVADAQEFRGARNDRRNEHRNQPRVQRGHEPRHDSRVEYRHDRSPLFRHPRPIVPRIENYWVAPRYETVFAGYDACGKPIYRTICVSAGYWSARPCF